MSNTIDEEILSELSQLVALMLWQLGAVKINITEPFKLVSGEFSPIYVNCRQLISNTAFMSLFTASGHMICQYRNVKADVIAGGETAGIPFAAFLAKSLGLPMVYVRKERKSHGLSTLVEGNLGSAASVLLVEDLITDGESKLHFINALKACGANVHNVLVLFDREQGGSTVLRKQEINLHAITKMSCVTKLVQQNQLLSGPNLLSLRQYLDSPHEWSLAHGN